MDSTPYADSSSSSSRKKELKNTDRHKHQNWNIIIAILLTSIPLKILVVSHNTQRLCALRCVYIFNHLMIHSYFACWFYEFEYAARINTHTANTLVIPLYRRFLCSVRWNAVGKIETTGVHSEWTQLFSLPLSVSWNYLLRFVLFEKRVVLTNCYFFHAENLYELVTIKVELIIHIHDRKWSHFVSLLCWA